MYRQLMKVLFLSLLMFNIITGNPVISRPEPASTLQQASTRVSINPVNGTANVGDNYTISVRVDDVVGLFGFGLTFRWGSAVLKYKSHVVTVPVEDYPNGVLHDPPLIVKDEVNQEQGVYELAATSLSIPPKSFNGSGTIFNMTFELLRRGECDIYLTQTHLSDPTGAPISHTREDAYFFKPALKKVPVANFTFTGGRKPGTAVVNKTTTFDGSPSYDQDPGGTISRYIWNFGDGTMKNTTNPIITHNYTDTNPYRVELTVLDNQGEGSQSKHSNQTVTVVRPNPVPDFTFQPDPAVLNKPVVFNGSASYDPDPEGNITEYTWNFGDGANATVTDPITSHSFTSLPEGGIEGSYTVTLKVKDSENLTNLAGKTKRDEVHIVERRDIDVMNVTVSPSELAQREDGTINITVANRGQATESFNVTAYYNKSTTQWAKIDQLTESILKQRAPGRDIAKNNIDWEFTHEPHHRLKEYESGGSPEVGDTKVRIGSSQGFWTINPGTSNTAAPSSSLDARTPLTTGGWTLEDVVLNGDFTAGNWAFLLRLYATSENVKAAIWTRILKSNNTNPQASDARVNVLKDWTRLFQAEPLPTEAKISEYDVSMPPLTFANEYVYFEFQLEVTDNPLGNSTTTVIFQVGGPTGDKKSQIIPTTFSYREQYTLQWSTEFTPAGNYVVKVTTTEVPHETNVANNIAYSGKVTVTAREQIPPLDVTVDVGSLHFRGEIAEFYILVTSSGERVNASVTATILFGHIVTELNPAEVEPVTTGVYLITYQIPTNATPGTYALMVEANRFVSDVNSTHWGTTIKGFLISPTLSGWNATLSEINDNTGVIITEVGEIKANLASINATLAGLIVGSQGEILARIDTALGPVTTKLDNINATVIEIEGNTMTINSTLGEAKVSLGAFQSTVTMGLAAASALSAVAAIVAILVFLRLRKLGEHE